jgi:hypothetical protein
MTKPPFQIFHPTVYYNWVNLVFSLDFPVFQESTILMRSEFFTWKKVVPSLLEGNLHIPCKGCEFCCNVQTNKICVWE